jgi:hypothetical protein
MKSKESVLKCPSCSEILPALANVCPSCNYVIAARNEGETVTLQELVYRIENTLGELKALPHPSVIRTIKENIFGFSLYLSLLFGASALLMNMKKYNDDYWGPLAGVAGCLAGIPLYVMAIRYMDKNNRKNKALEMGIVYTEETTAKAKTFKELKADFEKSKRLAKIFFGEDQKVKLLIEELNEEITKEEQKVLKAEKTNKFVYIGLGVLLLVPIFIPEHSYESTYSESSSSTSNSADFAPITIQGSSIESTGNIGSKIEVKIPEVQINFSGTRKYVSVQLPIKFSVKQGEKSKLSQEVSTILNGCKVSDYENKTLRNCAKITASIALSNGSGSPSGIKLLLTPDSERELLSALESSSDDFVLTFASNIDPKDLNNARNSGGGTVNIILSKEDN